MVLSVVTSQYTSSKYASDFCGFDRVSHACNKISCKAQLRKDARIHSIEKTN
jgi:hypothetical protein